MSNIGGLQTLYFRPRPPSESLGPLIAEVGIGAGALGMEVASRLPSSPWPEEDDKKHKKHHNLFQKIKEFILAAVPFSNEVANVLAHLKDKDWGLEWLYMHSPKGFIPNLSKYTIDFFALLSMVGNGINRFNEYLEKGASKMVSSVMGLWEASLYLIFSYIVPSFSIPATMKFFGNKFKPLDTTFGRFITGVIIGIGSLELGVKLCTKFITPLVEKFAYWLENKTKEFSPK